MSEAKHTPGPWVVEDNFSIAEKLQVAAFSEDGNRMLQVIVRSFNAAKDMKLIAAAPDLLDILERAVRRLEIAHANGDTIMREWIVDARAAIAKATGSKQ